MNFLRRLFTRPAPAPVEARRVICFDLTEEPNTYRHGTTVYNDSDDW